MLAILWCF